MSFSLSVFSLSLSILLTLVEDADSSFSGLFLFRFFLPDSSVFSRFRGSPFDLALLGSGILVSSCATLLPFTLSEVSACSLWEWSIASVVDWLELSVFRDFFFFFFFFSFSFSSTENGFEETWEPRIKEDFAKLCQSYLIIFFTWGNAIARDKPRNRLILYCFGENARFSWCIFWWII